MVPNGFAAEWQDAWNAHDLDRIMGHYRTDVSFRSQKAIALTGRGELNGAETLRACWTRALQRQPDLRFRVIDQFQGYDMLVLTYENHRGGLAAETLYFDDEGLASRGAACHRREA